MNRFTALLLSFLSLLAPLAFAATPSPLAIDRDTKRINEPTVNVPSGSTITFESGSTLATPSGSTWAAWGTNVTSLAGLRTAIGAGTGSGDLLAANNLSDLASAATARTNLGLAIGSNVQAYSATLAAIAGGTWTGASSITTLGTIATGTWQGSVIAPAYLGSGSSITTKFLRGDGTWQTISGTGDLLSTNNLSDVANASTARTNLGLAIGTNVQAYDATLSLLSGLSLTGKAGYALVANVTEDGFELTFMQSHSNRLDTIATLSDPNADRILFWDESAGSGGEFRFLTMGTGLSISGTTLSLGDLSSTYVPTSRTIAGNDLTGNISAATLRGSTLPSKTGNSGKVLAVKSDESDYELIAASGTGTVTSFTATDGGGFDFSVANSTTTPTLTATPDTTHGFIKRGFGDLSAINAGTPDFDGQLLTATDGAIALGTGTSAGNVSPLFVAGTGIVYGVNAFDFQQKLTLASVTTEATTLGSSNVSADNALRVYSSSSAVPQITATNTGSNAMTAIEVHNSQNIPLGTAGLTLFQSDQTTGDFAGKLGLDAWAVGTTCQPFYLTQFGTWSATEARHAMIIMDSTNGVKINGFSASDTFGSETKGIKVSAAGNLEIGGNSSASEARFLEPSGSGSNYTAFKAQAQSGDITYTLPASSSNGLLKNTSGTWSWGASGTDYAPATSGTSILKGDGSGGFSNATSGTDYGLPSSYITVSADRSTSSSSFSDVTDAAFSVAANKNYAFMFEGGYTTSATSEGAGFAINGPSSPTSIAYTVEIFSATDGSTSPATNFSTSYDAGLLRGSTAAAATHCFRVRGIIKNGSNAGTLALRFKTETNTTGTTTCKSGSFGVLTPLP